MQVVGPRIDIDDKDRTRSGDVQVAAVRIQRHRRRSLLVRKLDLVQSRSCRNRIRLLEAHAINDPYATSSRTDATDRGENPGEVRGHCHRHDLLTEIDGFHHLLHTRLALQLHVEHLQQVARPHKGVATRVVDGDALASQP